MKNWIKNQIRCTGWDLHRYSSHQEPAFQLLQGIEMVGADFIFDIGANAGQFCKDLRLIGFVGKLVSFEPLSAAHKILAANAGGDPNWCVHPRCAIGDFDGEIEINISGNSVSSSVLPMLEQHATAEPGSAYVGAERVPIARLDTVARAYLETCPE